MYLTEQMIWIIGGIVSVFLIVSMVMTIFIPFWVLEIRNQSIMANKKMDELIRLIGGEEAVRRIKSKG